MRYLLTAAAFLAATACSDTTAPHTLQAGPARHDTDVNQTEPSAIVAGNPCNGDAVELVGTLHILLHSTDAGSGNQHIYSDFTSSYSGVGEPSGVTYNGSTRTLDDFTTNAPYPIVYHSYQDLQLKSQTNVDNYTLKINFKITINANGIPTATIDDFSSTCNG
jgi:hypothetical protein